MTGKVSSNMASEWTKVHYKGSKMVHLGQIWKPEAYGQTVFPDWSILVGQKLVENAKIKQFNFW